MEVINYGILAQKQIKIIYDKSDKEIILNPYGVLYSDRIYLVAYNEWAKEIWTYRISKIKKIELTNNYFDKDKNFDIKTFASRSFRIYQGEVFDVLLQFNNEATVDAKEYFFHPTQKGKLNTDGTYTLTLKASGEYEIITELLKWRNGVKIIAPQSLKKTYNKTIREMFENIKE